MNNGAERLRSLSANYLKLKPSGWFSRLPVTPRTTPFYHQSKAHRSHSASEFLLRRFLINSREQPRHLIDFSDHITAIRCEPQSCGLHASSPDTSHLPTLRFVREYKYPFHHPGRQLMPLYHLIKCSFVVSPFARLLMVKSSCAIALVR